MISGMPAAIAARYGARPGASAVRDARIETMWRSVFRVAKPRPGKCFIDGITPADRRPALNALERALVTLAENDHVRRCW
jgi:hypothetical protein